MKTILKISIVLALFSCQKEYSCVCKSITKRQDTVIDKVKTTKLGSKGYKKTCKDHELQSPDLKDCHLR